MRELKRGEKYPAGRGALLNFGRLRERIKGLAAWHCVLYIEARLYPTVCPECGQKMHELPERRVRCPGCGLEVSRDEVPAARAARRLGEPPQTARSQRRGPSPRPAGESPGTRRAEGR